MTAKAKATGDLLQLAEELAAARGTKIIKDAYRIEDDKITFVLVSGHKLKHMTEKKLVSAIKNAKAPKTQEIAKTE